MALEAGSRLGPYEVVGLLGSGGMGEVYRARDPRLEREVAIKVLPDKIADPKRLRRFEQEARAAGALNHPNVVAVHDIGTHEGAPYVVSELLEGQTLRVRLEGGALPVRTALDHALQIAHGLAAVHDKGIIHRDLKPANVFITEDGRAKVLDFGLAKLTRPGPLVLEDERTATEATESGMVLGTVGYMSPEQVRGEEVDHRSDNFSFGAVLYEMLSGVRAFGRDSRAETMNAILKEDPPELSGTGRGIPPGLARIVQRCLEKRAGDRFHSAHDLALALEAASSGPSGPSAETASGSGAALAVSMAKRHKKRLLLSLAAMVLVAVGFYQGLVRSPAAPVARLVAPRQVTSSLGVEEYPAWSPDGRMLAYAASAVGEVEGGNWDIWVTDVGSGQPLNRTADHVGADRAPTWSPDGHSIAFWSDRDGGGCFVMPALAGGARKVASTGRTRNASAPQWSAQGSELACTVYEADEPFAAIVSLQTGQARRVALPGEWGTRLDLSWSPKGRSFAYVATPIGLTADVTQLLVVRIADGHSLAVSDARTKNSSPAWSPDERTLYFVSNRGGSSDLWRQLLSEDGGPLGEPERITTGVGMRQAALSRDGTRLAYSQGRKVANVWRVPVLRDRAATWLDARQVTFDQAFIEFVDVSRDGERLLLTSDRSGNVHIHVVPAGGGEVRPLSSDPAPDWAPRWSPDQREMVFYSNRTGNREIWTMPVESGPAHQVTNDPAADLLPTWSPDGRQIAFVSARSEAVELWTVPREGGRARQLTYTGKDPTRGVVPSASDWSPDGRWVVFLSIGMDQRLWRIAAAGHAAAQAVTAGRGGYPRWAPDGRTVYFVGAGERAPNLYAVPAGGGPERAVTDFRGRHGAPGTRALATDGRSLFFTWEEHLGDLWVAEMKLERR